MSSERNASVGGRANPAAKPATAPDNETPLTNSTATPANADRSALSFLGAPGRSLRSEEAEAWTSLVSAEEVRRAKARDRDLVVVDVRAAEDYAQGHVPGAVSWPREKWNSAPGLNKEQMNVVYCYSRTCPLGGEACALLAGGGYPVVEMDGGFEVWQSSDLEQEQGP